MQRLPKKASFAKLDSQETTAIVPKITYHGFCGTCATRLIGHACLFAEQGNRVRVPDTEGIYRRIAVCTFEIASARQGSESSCDSKVLFSMRKIPACGENRSLEGLSWLREKAETMRLCEKNSPHMNG